MKGLIDYISNNGIITGLVNIIIRKNDRNREDEKEKSKIRREEFNNKAKFHIENKKWDSKENPDIKIFLTDFKVNIDDNRNIDFIYREDVLNRRNYKHIQFYLKNVGKSDVEQIDICVTNQKHNMLCDVNSVRYIVKDKFISYNYLYDRTILQNDTILVDIAYLEDSYICNSFSSELALLFRDSYGNLYEQPFFIQERNLYEPFRISNEDYNLYTRVDKALECFKNPWMW